MTRHDIYRTALENHRSRNPHLSPVDFISSALGISKEKLYKTLEGERHFTVIEEEMFFRVTEFPQGFELKKKFVFPHNGNGKEKR